MAHGHYVRERTVENAEDSKMKAPDEEKFKPHADRWSTVPGTTTSTAISREIRQVCIGHRASYDIGPTT